MQNNKTFPFTQRQILVYLVGLIVYAFSVCLMAQANVGISPVTSIAYIFSIIANMTLGTAQLFVNILLILVQIVWLRSEFDKVQYFQIVTTFVFSIFIDMLMPLAMFVSQGVANIGSRILLFIIALIIMGVGLGTVAIANVVMLPGDGVAKTISRKLNWSFGKGKVLNDCICVFITCTTSFAFLGRLEGVQVGTIVAALVLGNIARLYMGYVQVGLKKFIDGKNIHNVLKQ